MTKNQVTKKIRVLEHGEQCALFEWAGYQTGRYPELDLMYAVPNWRVEKAHRIYLAAEGVKPGVPDIVLPAARGCWFGLYIEMKVGDNQPTEDQNNYLVDLIAQGYYATVCCGFEEARQTIEDYLSQPPTDVIRPRAT